MNSVLHATDTLVGRIDEVGAPACVGLDPDLERLPDSLADGGVGGVEAFCCSVIDAVADAVPAVKPQSACFERFGHAGVRVLERVCVHAREQGLIVILDAKRGDIGVSARHYATMAAGLGAHFITVNAYLGVETLEPYLEKGLGVFALVRTSNPGSDAIQAASTARGGSVADLVARELHTLGGGWMGRSGQSAVGAVVGATKGGDECVGLREAMPNAPLLIPGVGAQGGTVEGVRPLVRNDARSAGDLGVVINASRSVLYPSGVEHGSWQDLVRAAAVAFADDTKRLIPE